MYVRTGKTVAALALSAPLAPLFAAPESRGFIIGACEWSLRKAMDEIGYRGWIQIEAAAPKNLVTDYQANREFLKTVFPFSA
jgi:hypothetical protein